MIKSSSMMKVPFVNFKMTPTLNVGSTPAIIFGTDRHTCLIDGIVISNTTNDVLVVNLSIGREVTTPGGQTKFTFCSYLNIQPYDRVDVLLNATLTLETGDLLYAASNYSSNLFDTFVSYRELTEL